MTRRNVTTDVEERGNQQIQTTLDEIQRGRAKENMEGLEEKCLCHGLMWPDRVAVLEHERDHWRTRCREEERAKNMYKEEVRRAGMSPVRTLQLAMKRKMEEKQLQRKEVELLVKEIKLATKVRGQMVEMSRRKSRIRNFEESLRRRGMAIADREMIHGLILPED